MKGRIMAVDVDFLNGNNVNNINTNFQRVKDALQETLGRDGDLPNHMNTDLDMNSNDILNAKVVDAQSITIDGKPVNSFDGTFKGLWDSSTTYLTNDVVRDSGGNLWYAKQKNAGVTPSEGDTWTLFLPGVAVADGSITEPKYATGSVSTRTLAENVAREITTPAFRNAYTRKLVREFSMRGSYYDAILALDTLNYIYPQQMFIDFAANELFVVNLPNGTGTKQWVRVIDMDTGLDKTAFAAGTGTGETCIVRYEGGSRFLYARHTDATLGKYDVTTLPTALSTVAPTATYNNGLYFQGCERNGVWTLEDFVPVLGQSRRRYSFTTFGNDLLTPTGKVMFSLWDSGDLNTYKDYIPKRQTIAQGDGFYIGGYGATFTDGGTLKGEQITGVKVFDLQGRPIAAGLMDPQKAIDIIQGQGIAATRWENEGIFVAPDNTCYSLITTMNILDAGAAAGGLLLFEEFSTDENAIDFSTAAMSVAFSSEVVGRNTAGTALVDTTTGASVTTLAGILDAMKATDKKSLELYTSAIGVTDINGDPLPGFCRLFIENCNNATFFIHVFGVGVDNRYLVNGTPYAQTLLSRPGFRLFGSGSQSVTGATWTKLAFVTADRAVGATFDSANNRITPSRGVWRFNAKVHVDSGVDTGELNTLAIYKNGSLFRQYRLRYGYNNNLSLVIDFEDSANGTDYYEAFIQCNGATTKSVSFTSSFSWFNGEMI